MTFIACSLTPIEARAALGVFEHGTGIKSLGFGGVDYVDGGETTVISANPALTLGLGKRFDVGADFLLISSQGSITGNAAGPDQSFTAGSHTVFPIPQAGFTLPLSSTWAVGVAAFAAGLGPDYGGNGPYERFAAPAQAQSAASAQNYLKIAGLSLVVAHAVLPGQVIGLSLNVEHESLNLKGATPFAALSESPDYVSNVGKHGAAGASATVGWTGSITPWLTGGLSYRSKTFTQRIEEYKGLLPDHGRLELPPIYGGALEIKPAAAWRVAVEFQRYDYSAVHAFGNSIDLLFQGHPLGSSDGPGFGWSSQNAYKLGVSYQPTPSLTLRAGYVYATEIIQPSQTLFNLLAGATGRIHYTGGLSFAPDSASDLSGYAALAERRTVNGENSIPTAFGGGEANITFRTISFGISYGRHFGLAH